MKKLIKTIGLLLIMGGFSGVAYAKPNVDPAYLTCTIKFQDGHTTQGNGKNDLCLLYENVEGVEVIYYYDWYSQHFACEVEGIDTMYITKKIFRIDNYTVTAFGHEYTGAKGSLPGIANNLVVNNYTVGQFEPMSLIFHSNTAGEPSAITIHLQSGRAPLYKNIQCTSL